MNYKLLPKFKEIKDLFTLIHSAMNFAPKLEILLPLNKLENYELFREIFLRFLFNDKELKIERDPLSEI
jgi:hypothetical protein